ncbi:MAG TPA: patatin-like phospholipase family protein [Trueperaceae bacterium]|nr:patatin-like phospholipase family protein [Trueperaceae bacterium]
MTMIRTRDGLPSEATITRSIGLALSGGGARCFAQVGALVALEEAGFSVAAIAANSSAAILGAIYATRTDARALEAAVRDIDFSSFLDFDGSSGLFGHKGVEELLARHAAATFEDLAIPLAVPAVDIERAEMLVFAKGPLVPPVCASNAFPGLFVPVKYQGRNLMDGGIINNFPVDVIRTLTSQPVLAIDCRPSPTAPLDLDDSSGSSLVDKIGRLFNKGVPTVVSLLMQAYNITQDRVVEITCAMHPPDVRLVPELPDDLDIQDFSRMDEAIEIGYRCVTDAVAAGRLGALSAVD